MIHPESLAASAPRRAALLVHAMPRPDQAWLLASLAPHHRVELEGLLEELTTLGIPRDDTLLRQALEVPRDPTAEAMVRLERLTPAQVRDLVRVLQNEPPAVAACLLAARAWPWRDAVLQALPPACAEPRPRAAGLEAATCASVLRLLGAGPSAVHPAAKRWKQWLPVRRAEQRP